MFSPYFSLIPFSLNPFLHHPFAQALEKNIEYRHEWNSQQGGRNHPAKHDRSQSALTSGRPAPKATRRGITPRMNANEVITIGRRYPASGFDCRLLDGHAAGDEAHGRIQLSKWRFCWPGRSSGSTRFECRDCCFISSRQKKGQAELRPGRRARPE